MCDHLAYNTMRLIVYVNVKSIMVDDKSFVYVYYSSSQKMMVDRHS
jgi:hypothetical protein